MPDQTYTLLIDTQGNLAGVNAAQGAVRALDRDAQAFFDTLRLGVGIDLGGRLVSGLAQVPGRMQAIVERGVRVNAELEKAADNLRALLLAAGESAPAADAALDPMLRQLEAAADLSGQADQAVRGLFQATIPLATQAGAKTRDWAGLMGEAARAAENLSLPIEQLQANLGQLLSGDVSNRNKFARMLGIEEGDLQKAMQAGRLVDFLREKMRPWQTEVAGVDTAWNRLHNAMDRTLGAATQGLFARLAGQVDGLAKAVQSPAFQEGVTRIAGQISFVLDQGVQLTQWAAEHADILLFLAKAVAAWGAALGAVKLAAFLQDLVRHAFALRTNAAALSGETAALGANTAAQRANQAARVGNAMAAGAQAAAQGATAAGAAAAGAVGAGGRAAAAGRGVLALAGGPVGVGVIAGSLVLDQELKIAAAMLERIRREDEIAEKAAVTTRALREQVLAMAELADRDQARAALLRETGALEQEMLAARGRGADTDTLAVLQTELEMRRRLLASLDQTYARVSAINVKERERAAGIAALNAHDAEMARRAPEAAASIERSLAVLRQQDWDRATPEDRLGMLRRDDAAIQRQFREKTKDMVNPYFYSVTPDEGAVWREAELAKDAALIENDRRRAAVLEEIRERERQGATERLGQAAALRREQEELAIAEARAAGDHAAADRLEREKRLREEIARILESTNASRAEAADLAERRLKAEEGIAARAQAPSAAAPAAPAVDSAPAPERKPRTLKEAMDRLRGAPGWTAQEQKPGERPPWARPGTTEGWTARRQKKGEPPAWTIPWPADDAVPVAPQAAAAGLAPSPAAPRTESAAAESPPVDDAAVGLGGAAESASRQLAQAGARAAAAITAAGQAQTAQIEALGAAITTRLDAQTAQLSTLAAQIKDGRNT